MLAMWEVSNVSDSNACDMRAAISSPTSCLHLFALKYGRNSPCQ